MLPAGREARVKTLHSQGRPGERAVEGERAAINLAGLSREDAGRGDWIAAPGILQPSVRFDAAVTILASEREAIRHWTAVHVHHGTGHVTGRVALLDKERLEPGESGLAQIRVDRPLVPAWGDRVSSAGHLGAAHHRRSTNPRPPRTRTGKGESRTAGVPEGSRPQGSRGSVSGLSGNLNVRCRSEGLLQVSQPRSRSGFRSPKVSAGSAGETQDASSTSATGIPS